MTRPDTHTSTEDAAARYERATAYQSDEREHDEHWPNAADHDCSKSPHPETCWGCLAFVRANDLEWQAHVDEQNAEYWQEGA